MNLRWLKKKEQKNLLAAFIGGSLVVILICLTVTSVLFAYFFIKKERQRAQISRGQVAHFFNFQYSNMAEEMWTKNVEAIGIRIGFIAREMGNAQYEFILADDTGRCLVNRLRNGTLSPLCELPESLQRLMVNPPRASEWRPNLQFDETTKTYIYAAPLYVGPVLKGYLNVSLSDPYGFYRGGILDVAISVLFPAILFILCVWFLWLIACRRLFLRPYLASVREMGSARNFLSG